MLAQDQAQMPSPERAAQIIRTSTLPPLTAETHLLDSFLGKWNFTQELRTLPGIKLTGTWTFSRMSDGFMIFDEFRTANGVGGTIFLGETYRAYNLDTKAWTFEAVNYVAPANPSFKSGKWDAGTTRFENGDMIDEITNGDTITRFRFYNIKKTGFSLHGETSKDGGKTWVSDMEIECVRAQQ